MLNRSSSSVARAVGRIAGALVLVGGLAAPLRALQTEDRQLQANCEVTYRRETVAVERFVEVFTAGQLHRRARLHGFAWDWEEERTEGEGQTRDHGMLAAGGSLVFRSARWHGWSGTAGLYTTQPLHRENTVAAVPGVNFGRAGKDTYRTRADGSEVGMTVLAEAFAEYRRSAGFVRAGRQIIESLLLASNDSKMIPNTFEALRAEWRPRGVTRVGAGFIRRQKLRDHATFHSVLAYAKGEGNDDSGAHRGLTPRNLVSGGLEREPHLWLFTVEDRSLPNFHLRFEHVAVEGAFGTTVAEAGCAVGLPRGWRLRPALRYLRQVDAGAGAVGGAALSGALARDRDFTTAADRERLASYRDPFSLAGALWAARLQLARGPLQITVGTSVVRDRADIVAPWRGFPSGGYTRLMGQVDWLAGAVNRTARLEYDLGGRGVWSRLGVTAAFTRMDFDDRKIAAGTVRLTDRDFLAVEVIAGLRALPRTGFKLRLGSSEAEARPALSAAANHESYQELRFDVNHFF